MKQVLSYLIIMSTLLFTVSAQAGWMDKLKEGIDDVKQGVDKARDVIDKKSGGNTNTNKPPSQPTPQQHAKPQQKNQALLKQQQALQEKYKFKIKSNWPLLEIKSTDPEIINPLKLESYKGVIMLGHIIRPNAGFHKVDGPTQRYFQKNLRIYQYLLQLTEKRARLDREKLKAGYLRGSDTAGMSSGLLSRQYLNGQQNERMWFVMLTNLARDTFTDAARQKYFCPKSGACKSGGKGGSWGGFSALNPDQFHAKRMFNEFVDKELDKYFAMAKTLPRTAYILYQKNIGQYDFEKGGYRIDIQPKGYGFIQNKYSVLQNNGGINSNNMDAYKKYRNTYIKYYYHISEDKAPAFADKVKQNGNVLTILYKVSNYKPFIDPRTQTTDLLVGNRQYLFDPSNIKINAYFDLSFKEKVFSVP
jgi:hypothetical protein